MKTTYFNTRSAARAFAKANGVSVKDGQSNGAIVVGNDRWYVEHDENVSVMMTLQEVFDKVATHLLKQGKRSEDDGMCLYRGPDESMCAAGSLINNSFYTKDIEGSLSSDSIVMAALISSGVPADDTTVRLVRRLQRTHDMTGPEKWPRHLKAIATDYNLSAAVVK